MTTRMLTTAANRRVAPFPSLKKTNEIDENARSSQFSWTQTPAGRPPVVSLRMLLEAKWILVGLIVDHRDERHEG